MKAILQFLKTTLLGGILVVLPAWLAVLLLLKVILKLNGIVKPVSAALPPEVNHPQIIAALVFVAMCFLVGLLMKTAIGRQTKKAVEAAVLDHVPGYATLRSVAEQIGDTGSNHGFQPALIEIEDALAPGFIVETHPDGRCTVFLPSAPTPAAGTILIIAAARVHPVDVPVTKMFQCVTKWGAGSGELLAHMQTRGTV